MGRHAQGRGRAVGRRLRHRRLPQGRARSLPRPARRAGRQQRPGTILVDMTTSEPSLAVEIAEAAKAKGVHSVDAPVSGGDVGAKKRGPVDHDRRRQGSGRCPGALLAGDGQDHRPPGRPRRGPAHQDGQPDPDRQQHDRRLRSLALRLSGRARPRNRGAVGRLGRGRQLVAVELWARGSWPAISSPAFSSSISSRTWASLVDCRRFSQPSRFDSRQRCARVSMLAPLRFHSLQ